MKLFHPIESMRVTVIPSFSIGRFYKDHPLSFWRVLHIRGSKYLMGFTHMEI